MDDYDADIHAWAIEQAEFLRGRQFDRLDTERLADEVEHTARQERQNMADLVTNLLAQLLLWQAGQHRPAVAMRIKAQREAVGHLFSRCPSLRPTLAEPPWLNMVWTRAQAQALSAGFHLDGVDEHCPWKAADVLEDGWLP